MRCRPTAGLESRLSAEAHRLLDAATLVYGFDLPIEQALDLGACSTLQIRVRILVNGSGGGVLQFQHAAVNKPDDYADLSGATVTLNGGVGRTLVTVTHFTRFIKVHVTTADPGSPVVTVDIVAKS